MGDCRYACESCGKWCHSREDLVEHNVTHAKEKPYQCQHCHVWFPRTNMLVEHITTTHADEVGLVYTAASLDHTVATRARLDQTSDIQWLR